MPLEQQSTVLQDPIVHAPSVWLISGRTGFTGSPQAQVDGLNSGVGPKA